MLPDEPFAALAIGLRVVTRKLAVGVLHQAAISIIPVTRDQNEALSFADPVVVMHGGSLGRTGVRFPVASSWALRVIGEVVAFPDERV